MDKRDAPHMKALHRLSRLGQLEWSQARFYLILGDIHGHIQRALTLAIHLQCLLDAPIQAVFQVGDFGFWPRGRQFQQEDLYYKQEDALDFFTMRSSSDLRRFFSAGEATLETLSAPLYFIRGNHEDFEMLQTLSKEHPTEVLSGIYFLPDYFAGEAAGLRIAAVGGILTDIDRGKGKQARILFKKAQQQAQTDPRRTSAQLLAQAFLSHYDLLLTHSGLSSRETRDGSRQLETYLHQQTIRLHFYGHHHRFSCGQVGQQTLSIGLRSVEEDAQGSLRTGSFAIVAWKDRNNFEVYSDVQPGY
ncbi:MAG TPA: metallophosphoesterase [Ktedonobacteraceae bacterium]|nr:metallophosphoesterase [Ktedonobacteraceae bacterium]